MGLVLNELFETKIRYHGLSVPTVAPTLIERDTVLVDKHGNP